MQEFFNHWIQFEITPKTKKIRAKQNINFIAIESYEQECNFFYFKILFYECTGLV